MSTRDSDIAKPSELHADCLAGAYLADAYDAARSTRATLDQARTAAYSVGDDDVNHPDHHGTSQERGRGARTGIGGGDCKVYAG